VKALALFLLLIPMAARAQNPGGEGCANTPAYTPCELSFELGDRESAAHSNPYVTVELRVEFRSPRRRTFAMPAFWDGGKRMVVRFSPTEAGQWDYHVTSNIAVWNDKTGAFTATPSESPGFIRAANMHHWAYTEKTSTGLDQAHLWMGANELLFASMDDAAFRATVDARTTQKFNHLRGIVVAGSNGVYSSPDAPDLAFFKRLDERVRYLNAKGLIADLVLAGGPGTLTRLFPGADQRRRFVRHVVARYAAMNVTWQGVDEFEDYQDGRALLKEIGAAIKQFDPYQHPRTTGARFTSTPLLDDGWMDFAAQGKFDSQAGAIEHQLYAVPFVHLNLGREDSGAGKSGPNDLTAEAFRKRLWNATMDGQYVTYANTGSGAQHLNSPGAKAMTVWYDLLSDTRHWELEPYFDVDGGRALALEDVEYLVYVEKPGPLELTVEKHSYDVYWINPINGESIKPKKFSGEHFTGEPPDKSHDWLLHVVREGRVAGMNKSYKFESREIVLQEVESNSAKVPFAIEQPSGDLSMSKPTPYAAKIAKPTRATRQMMWLWMGDVAADGQGYRVLATGQSGTFTLPPDIARNFPAILHLRLYGMNANGKVYESNAAHGIER
jgi:hypothetical protein